jgi:hypothetical protein
MNQGAVALLLRGHFGDEIDILFKKEGGGGL